MCAENAGASAETWGAEAGSFTYDANGNLKTSPTPYSLTAVIYDHRNLATSVTRARVTTGYRYNEGGWRITKQVGTGSTEVYVQDGPLTLGVFTVSSPGMVTSWYGNRCPAVCDLRFRSGGGRARRRGDGRGGGGSTDNVTGSDDPRFGRACHAQDGSTIGSCR